MLISGAGTRGRLERCDLSRNAGPGMKIGHLADPLVIACK